MVGEVGPSEVNELEPVVEGLTLSRVSARALS